MAVNDEFVRETATQLRDLSDGLIALEQSPDDGETLDATFRTAHSLKGNCSMEGLDDASTLAHAVEDLLSAVREGALEPESDLVDEALAAVDTIETLVEAAAEDGDAPNTSPQATADALRAMVDARRDDSGGHTPTAPAPETDDADTEGFDPEVRAALEGASEYDDLDALLAQMEDPPEGEDPFEGEEPEPTDVAPEPGSEVESTAGAGGATADTPSADAPPAADAGSDAGDSPMPDDAGSGPMPDDGDDDLLSGLDGPADEAGDPDDLFAEMKAEIDDETSDEDALESLQSDIDQAAFGEFDDDDDLSIGELLEGPGEDDDWGEEAEAFDMDLGEPPEPVAETDDDVESGFDGSGPFDESEPTDSGDVFAEMKAEVEDETGDEDALADLQADIEAAGFGEFDDDDDLSIADLLAGPEDDEWEFDDAEMAADVSADVPTDAGPAATDDDVADALAEAGEGLSDDDAAGPFAADADAEPSTADVAEAEPAAEPAAEATADADAVDAEPAAADAADAGVEEAEADAADVEIPDAEPAEADAEPSDAPEPAAVPDDLEPAVTPADGEVETPAVEADADEAEEPAAPEPVVVPDDLEPAIVPAEGEVETPTVDDETVEAEEPAEAEPAAADAAADAGAEPVEAEAPEPAATPGDLEPAVVRADAPPTLEDVPGIGSAKAESLREAGYESVADVQAADRDALSEVSGIGPALADQVKEAVGEAPEPVDAEADAVEPDAEPADAEAEADAPEPTTVPDDLEPAIAPAEGEVETPTVDDETVEAEPADEEPAEEEPSVEDEVPAFDEFDASDDELDPDVDDLLDVDIPGEEPAEAAGAAEAGEVAEPAAAEAADADAAVDEAEPTDPDVDDLLDVEIPDEEPAEAAGADAADAVEADFGRDRETEAFEDRFGHLFGHADEGEAAEVRSVNTIDDSSLDERFAGAPAMVDDARSALDRVESITVDVDDADDLLTLAEELTTTRFSLERSLPEELSDDAVAALSKLQSATAGLRRTVMNVRLMPFERATQGLARTARDTARAQGKEVNFSVEGREVGLDRDIIDRLRDPLVHLVRNAIDHGIEPPGERVEDGKPEAGQVTVRAEQVRDGVTVEVEDDGRGIDVESVREHAVEAGFLDQDEAEEAADEELYEYVFRAGFSTAPEVTDVSGRGVGMDVVDRVVSDLDGSVTVDSALGEGTTVRLELPITVAVAEVVFVAVGDETYGVPMTAVESIEPVDAIEVVDGEERLHAPGDAAAATDGGVEGTDDPARVVRIDEAFGIAGDPDATGKAVRIRPSVRNVALRCDEVVDTREVVIKPYEDVLGDLPGLSGATLLGNGELVNIIDVGTI